MQMVTPPAIEEVISSFDSRAEAIDEYDVRRALIAAGETLVNPTEVEKLGAWAEVLAFSLDDDQHGNSPWGTYFRPYGSATREDGSTVYFPDIAGADARVVEHWMRRARTVTHPVLKARYADLAWDMSRAVAGTNPDPDMARIAIDAYIASVAESLRRNDHMKFRAACRALDLAVTIRDNMRRDAARAALLRLHRSAIAAGTGLWWIAFDRLVSDRRVGLTDGERDELVADLENVVARHSNQSDSTIFDPHLTQDAAERLIKYYRRCGRNDDAKRLSEVIGRTFEHFASLAEPMLASVVLQTAANAYRDARMREESQRARVLMEEKIIESHGQMKPVIIKRTISRENLDKFLEAVIANDLASTFARIAFAFLPNRAQLELEVARELEETPFQALITQSIMGDRHVAAQIGSVVDDPSGRLIHRTAQQMRLAAPFLVMALEKAVEVHDATPGHFVGWVARSKLFDNLTLLMEGVAAWYHDDLVKAVHVLVPQIEVGLRQVVGALGRPVTKPHPAVAGVSVAKGMGDIVYDKEVVAALGDDLALYFQALYADPRGLNVRNDLAHGLLEVDRIDLGLACKIIHSLLVLGIWEELAQARSPESERGQHGGC